jgi:hypothetical protein
VPLSVRAEHDVECSVSGGESEAARIERRRPFILTIGWSAPVARSSTPALVYSQHYSTEKATGKVAF